MRNIETNIKLKLNYFKVRIWDIAAILLIFILLLFLFRLLNDEWVTTCITWLISVLTSILAALFYTHYQVIMDRQRDVRYHNNLKKLIGITSNSREERPYVVLPLHGKKADLKEDRQWLSFDDIVALRHISTMLAKNRAPAPRICFDTDKSEILFSKIKDVNKEAEKRVKETGNDIELIKKELTGKYEKIRIAKSYFVIGLYSNDIIEELVEMSQKRSRLSDGQIIPFSYDQKDINGNRHFRLPNKGEKDLIDWHETHKKTKKYQSCSPDNEGTSTWAIIAKMKIQDDKTLIIIAGLNSRGTRKAASWLRKNWDSIRVDEKKIDVGEDRSFALGLCVSKVTGIAAKNDRQFMLPND